MNITPIEKILNDWPLWQDICDNKPNLDKLTPLVDGLTNSNWLLEITNEQTTETQQYVIRINATNNLALKLNRQAEWDMHQSISGYGICPPFLYRDPNDIYWIRPFLKTHTLETTISQNKDFISSDFLKVITQHFKTIHNSPISNTWPTIDYPELIDHYWQQIALEQQNTIDENKREPAEKQKNKLDSIKEILQLKLKGYSYTQCLCHMDPNPSNWILDQEELHLIDWEYAALGNPAWDLAVFTDTCNLNQEQIHTLLNYYQAIDPHQLHLARAQMKYLSILWFTVQGHLTDSELLEQLKTLKDNLT